MPSIHKMRARTGDRGPPDGSAPIHTTEQLGPNRSLLPNGFLLCRNVPLARVGWMQYGEGEVPVPVNEHGVAHVERTEDALFNERTLGSFIGAAFTDEHPDVDVTPENWNKLAKGYVLTARRGEGEFLGLVVGDILVTDREMIDSVLEGKREVSAGYDADYEVIDVGIGRQHNIIVNHVAGVDKGRCGPRCAIGDRAFQPTNQEDSIMPAQQTTRARQRPVVQDVRAQVRTIFAQATRDAEALLDPDAEAAEINSEASGGGAGTHIHLHMGKSEPSQVNSALGKDEELGEGAGGPAAAGGGDPNEARFAAIEEGLKTLGDAVAQIAAQLGGGGNPAGGEGGAQDGNPDDLEDEVTGDAAGGGKDPLENGNGASSTRTGDSMALATSYKEVTAKAEILVPGFRMPTFDAKVPRAKTIDSMCNARRRCLDAAYATKDGQSLILGVSGRRTLDLDGLGCKDVAILFNAASGARAAANNAVAQARTTDSGAGGEQKPAMNSIKAMNDAAAKFWENRTAKV